MGARLNNFNGFSQGEFQQYQQLTKGGNVLGGQEGANQITDTLTNESTKQLRDGNLVMMADGTKKNET